MPKSHRSVIAAYVPVLHRGYLEFFERFNNARELWIFGQSILDDLEYLQKDLRALKPDQQLHVVKGLERFVTIKVIEKTGLSKLDVSNLELIMPDEDVSRLVAGQLKNSSIILSPVFLRWDRRSVEMKSNQPDAIITDAKFEKTIMQRALRAASKSTDIWRRVGAVLISKDGKEVGISSNQGEPTPFSPWAEGDPRNIFSRGVGIEMSIYSHAEAVLIAEAAKRGTALLDADIYVTTFPCPVCAKLIARSGIKRCYYKDGYAVLDGKRVLEDYGVEIFRVVTQDSNESGPEWVPYSKKTKS